jgi:hypothetical protein
MLFCFLCTLYLLSSLERGVLPAVLSFIMDYVQHNNVPLNITQAGSLLFSFLAGLLHVSGFPVFCRLSRATFAAAAVHFCF